jgi:hypothetical protein
MTIWWIYVIRKSFCDNNLGKIFGLELCKTIRKSGEFIGFMAMKGGGRSGG